MAIFPSPGSLFNRVAFGSFNFYLNVCFPAEVLENTALASWSSAEPLETELSAGSADNPFCCWKLPADLLPGSFPTADPVPALFPHRPLSAGQV